MRSESAWVIKYISAVAKHQNFYRDSVCSSYERVLWAIMFTFRGCEVGVFGNSFDEKWQKWRFYILPTKTRGFAPQPDPRSRRKMTKMAGASQAKPPFAKNTVFAIMPTLFHCRENEPGKCSLLLFTFTQEWTFATGVLGMSWERDLGHCLQTHSRRTKFAFSYFALGGSGGLTCSPGSMAQVACSDSFKRNWRKEVVHIWKSVPPKRGDICL